jgi:hypothetical protein
MPAPYWSCSACLSLRLARIASRSETGSRVSDSSTDKVNCTHVLGFDRAAVLADLLVDVGLFPAHAPGGVIFRRLEPDTLVLGLHQLGDGFTREHVDLEFAAGQLFPKMLTQRLLVDLELIGDFGLGDAESRSTLDEGS